VPLQVGQPFNPYGLFVGIYIPDALVRNTNVSAGAKIAYGRLARYAGADGDCHPSIKALAREIGVQERQAQRYLAELERNSFIRPVPRFKGPNIRDTNGFVFLWHESLSESIRNTTPSVSHSTPPPVSAKTPPPASDVTPKETHGKEGHREQSPSSSPSASTPPSPTPSHNANELDDEKPKSEKAELIDLIRGSTGQPPDRRLFRDITEALELRGVPLREYLDDIRPRLGRLKHPPRPGFFRHHATSWRDSRPVEKPVEPVSREPSRCPVCSGSGRTPNGYCTCTMGQDLMKVESRARKKSGGNAGKEAATSAVASQASSRSAL
jgi:Helix-turn-helix domain